MVELSLLAEVLAKKNGVDHLKEMVSPTKNTEPLILGAVNKKAEPNKIKGKPVQKISSYNNKEKNPVKQSIDLEIAQEPDLAVSKTPETNIVLNETAKATDVFSPEIIEELTEEISDYLAEVINDPINWTVDLSTPQIESFAENSEAVEFDKEIFLQSLSEMFGDNTKGKEAIAHDALETEFTQSIETVSDEDTLFMLQMAELIKTLEPETADKASEVFDLAAEKIQLIVEDLDITNVDISQVFETHSEELDELLDLCSQLLEYLGFENTDQNVHKLLLQLFKSAYATRLQNSQKVENISFQEIGTHEHKFNPAFTDITRFAVNKFNHSALGQLALAVAVAA